MTVTRLGPRGSLGFTLIELVLVIVIAGILSAVAGPRFFDSQVYQQHGYAAEVAGALRFAQKAAVATGCSARLNLSAGSYVVQQQAASGNTCNPNDTTWATTVSGLDGNTVQGSAPSGVVAAPLGAYVFNSSGALSASPGTSLTVGTLVITIDSSTGYVQGQ